MLRLKFNPTPNNPHTYASVFGDLESIWSLWFKLREHNIAAFVFCAVSGQALDPTKGVADLHAQRAPAYYGDL